MQKAQPIRVMITDDHRMVRDGLKMFLSIYDDIEVIATRYILQLMTILKSELFSLAEFVSIY